MSRCQPVDTPIEGGMKLWAESNQISIDKGTYQRLVGRLLYLAHTRPDLSYALSVENQYRHNLGELHMNAIIRILRYLKCAPRTLRCIMAKTPLTRFELPIRSTIRQYVTLLIIQYNMIVPNMSKLVDFSSRRS